MRKYKKLIIFALLMVLGLFISRKIKLRDYVGNLGNLKEIEYFIEQNYFLSVSLYLLFTILGSSILVLPGVTFAILASGLFGPWLGSLYCLIGTTVGALVSFLLSRYLLRDSIEDLVKKNEKLYKLIFEIESERETLVLMITRLIPIFPFNLQNYAYGITNISTIKYTLGTFLFMIPGTLIFSLGTEGIINNKNSMFAMAALMLLLMLVMGKILYAEYEKLVIGEKNEG